MTATTPTMELHASGRSVALHWCPTESCMEFQGVQLCEVPRTTRLGFVLRGYTSDGKMENLAAGSVTLLDIHGAMRQGEW